MDTHPNKNNNERSKMYIPEAKLKLVSSASDQNVFFTYICMVNDLKPTEKMAYDRNGTPSFQFLNAETEEIDQEDQPIQVERSKALHELVESHRKHISIDKLHSEAESSTTYPATTSGDDSELSDTEDSNKREQNPNILKLTKMKWLTEEQEGSPDSSSPILSPIMSSTSTNGSRESDDAIDKQISVSDKYLSTILRLDREHNMFGLSNITIVGSRPSRKLRKDDERPVFHQTAIVQICCGRTGCKYSSKTDLPSSLKCGRSCGCCNDPGCVFCADPCLVHCNELQPCPSLTAICPRAKCTCKASPCAPIKCKPECTTCFGMKISFNRKPKYEPSPIELTPRSSCVLQKPFAARSCHHLPQCIPPSSCFPYLMPCFWPARAGAPCNTPTRCFHNPPCRPPRRKRLPLPPQEVCPPKCEDSGGKTKCENLSCPGNNPVMKKEIENRFGSKQ